MARTRSIKPGFFDNETLGDLPPLTRLLFIGLWCIADREGRLEDKPRRIKKILLGYDDIDAEGTDSMLQSLHDSGFICRYSMGEERYIEVVNFTKHQNPHVKEKASVIPPPLEEYMPNEAMYGGHQCSTVQAPDKHHASTGQAQPITFNRLPSTGYLSPTNLPDGGNGPEEESEDQQPGESLTVKKAGTAAGNETREQPSKTLAERFAMFWDAYPKKKSKGDAEKAWKAIKPDNELLRKMLEGLGKAQKSKEWLNEGGQFIPYPGTWLRAKGWEDEYEEGTPSGINSRYISGAKQQPAVAPQGAGSKPDALAGFKTIDDYDHYKTE